MSDWLAEFRQRVAAGQAAVQGAGSASALPSSQGASSPATAPRSEQQSAEDEEAHYLDFKLDAAGVTDGDERRWLVEAWKKLSQDRQKRASAAIGSQDIDDQSAAVQLLRREAGPMPAGFRNDPDDDIPFRRPEYRELFDERMRWRF